VLCCVSRVCSSIAFTVVSVVIGNVLGIDLFSTEKDMSDSSSDMGGGDGNGSSAFVGVEVQKLGLTSVLEKELSQACFG